MKKNRISDDHSCGMKAAMAMNSGMTGIVLTASVTICTTPSNTPPKYPADPPMISAKTKEMTTPSVPTASEV